MNTKMQPKMKIKAYKTISKIIKNLQKNLLMKNNHLKINQKNYQMKNNSQFNLKKNLNQKLNHMKYKFKSINIL